MNLSQPAAFEYNDASRATASQRWTTWKEELNIFIAASGLDATNTKDMPRIKSILLNVAGAKVRELRDNDRFDRQS